MIDTSITFEKIPEALALILQRIEAVERKVDTLMSSCIQQQSQDRWMNIDDWLLNGMEKSFEHRLG